ncbi:MAG: radical SAM protein [candidate division WOR-3 bacterium]|nr:MAG: radical SAM protein [candidate division WOR-3 bacterium]
MKHSNCKPRALLINPWVYDFKAFDFWSKPVGLLIVSNVLKKFGFSIAFIDCMDRQSPYFTTETKTDIWGRGKYHYEEVEKPHIFRQIPRRYKRYGIPRDTFIRAVQDLETPDFVFITSSMTYWYPGVFEAIRILRLRYPGVKIVLGGIYATLCEKHARKKSGADIIVTGAIEEHIPELVAAMGLPERTTIGEYSYAPDYSLYDRMHYGVILTSRGCPFDCTYCATRILCGKFSAAPVDKVLTQIAVIKEKNRNVSFFDDALLYNKSFPNLLRALIEEKYDLTLHASNGLHCRYITQDIARLMFEANFQTIYLSLETTNPLVQNQTGGKVNTEEFKAAVQKLTMAGFAPHQIHTYILYGIPGQGHDEIIDSIKLCHDLGVHPHLCEFSPIPHTAEYEKTGFDENTDPLYHNNLFYTWYYPQPRIELYKKTKRLLSKKIPLT